jgi:hypothetical protein
MERIHCALGECCDLFLEVEGADVDVCSASSVARLEPLRSANVEEDDLLSLDRADSLFRPALRVGNGRIATTTQMNSSPLRSERAT